MHDQTVLPKRVASRTYDSYENIKLHMQKHWYKQISRSIHSDLSLSHVYNSTMQETDYTYQHDGNCNLDWNLMKFVLIFGFVTLPI